MAYIAIQDKQKQTVAIYITWHDGVTKTRRLARRAYPDHSTRLFDSLLHLIRCCKSSGKIPLVWPNSDGTVNDLEHIRLQWDRHYTGLHSDSRATLTT